MDYPHIDAGRSSFVVVHLLLQTTVGRKFFSYPGIPSFFGSQVPGRAAKVATSTAVAASILGRREALTICNLRENSTLLVDNWRPDECKAF